MSSIVLSIKPEFFEKIKSGEKKFEFRRSIPNQKIDKIFWYVSFPVCKIIGVSEIGKTIKMPTEALWLLTCKKAGIQKDEFEKYFDGKWIGNAFEIKNLQIFKNPKELKEFGIEAPVENFAYIKKAVI